MVGRLNLKSTKTCCFKGLCGESSGSTYLLLLLVFRLAGRRTLAQMTSLVFLLIVSEGTQNAMIGDDYSLTNGMLVVLTLVGLDIF